MQRISVKNLILKCGDASWELLWSLKIGGLEWIRYAWQGKIRGRSRVLGRKGGVSEGGVAPGIRPFFPEIEVLSFWQMLVPLDYGPVALIVCHFFFRCGPFG